jgi:hypothetical protein
MIQPIETHYKGYRFRSRIEARWAVFFDHLGIVWDYEKEGYELGELGRYLPDFWLENVGFAGGEHGMFVEVKSILPTEKEMKKLDKVATTLNARSGFLIHMANDVTGQHIGLGRGFHQKNMVFIKCLSCSEMSFDWGGLTFIVCHECGAEFPLEEGARHKDIVHGIQLAKSARFEFLKEKNEHGK